MEDLEVQCYKQTDEIDDNCNFSSVRTFFKHAKHVLPEGLSAYITIKFFFI